MVKTHKQERKSYMKKIYAIFIMLLVLLLAMPGCGIIANNQSPQGAEISDESADNVFLDKISKKYMKEYI